MAMKKVKTSFLDKFPTYYKNFYIEWKYGKQTPVQYIPEEGTWKRNTETGHVELVNNRPIKLSYPAEFNNGLWGGEAVVKGFQKRHPLRRRVPHFWFPLLQKSVFYSDILDKYLEITVTPRTLRLVDQHYGFDNYILDTSPQDLKSILGIKLKRTLLLALVKKDFLPNNPEKRNQLLEKHKRHILPEEEAEWFGLTLTEAAEKLAKMEANENHVEKKPMKLQFREEFLEQLKEKGLPEPDPVSRSPSSLLGRLSSLNPFQSNKSM